MQRPVAALQVPLSLHGDAEPPSHARLQDGPLQPRSQVHWPVAAGPLSQVPWSAHTWEYAIGQDVMHEGPK